MHSCEKRRSVINDTPDNSKGYRKTSNTYDNLTVRQVSERYNCPVPVIALGTAIWALLPLVHLRVLNAWYKEQRLSAQWWLA